MGVFTQHCKQQRICVQTCLRVLCELGLREKIARWLKFSFCLQAIHVGDTTADIGMGVTAKLGATVGVLSGVGNVEHLDEGGADHIVPSVKHVLSIALK